MTDPMSTRMKGYEQATRTAMPRRMPVIVRLDGKAFHTWTREFPRPFSGEFSQMMDAAAVRLCEEMQGAVLAYVQSDEISVLLHNYRRLATAAWFDNEVQKIVSVSASIAAAVASCAAGRPAFFDARAFVLPESEVCNYFIWRQQDATRNSIQMVAQSLYSPKELHRKNCNELQDMIHAKGQNWNDLSAYFKRGRSIVRENYEVDGAERSRWAVDIQTPVFTSSRWYVEKHLAVEAEEPKPVPRFGEVPNA